MIKKVVLIIFGLFIISIIFAIFLTALNTKEKNMQAEFNKIISVSPSTISSLQSGWYPQNYPDSIMEVRGLYSVEYDSPSIVLVTDEPMTLKNLRNIKVYRNSLSGIENKTEAWSADNYETSEIQLQSNEFEVFEFIIEGPTKTSSDIHNGSLFLNDKSTPAPEGESMVRFRDNNFTGSVNFDSSLIPYDDFRKQFIILPFNDFRVILNNDEQQTSRVFEGMRNIVEYYSIYGRPWSTDVTGQSKNSYDIGLGTPSVITINGESLSSIKFLGFNGWYKVENEEAITHDKGILNWEIKDAKSSKIILNMKSQAPSKVLVNVQYQGKAGDLILNNNTLLSFQAQSIKNLYSIWSSDFFKMILTALVATIIALIFKEKSENKKAKIRVPKKR